MAASGTPAGQAAPTPRRRLTGAVLAAVAAFAASNATASALRCEDASGRITYTNAECPPGTQAQRAVSVPAAPSMEQQRDARAVAERERRDVEALRKAREAELRQLEQQRSAERKADEQRARECERQAARVRTLAEDLTLAERRGAKGRESLETRLRRARVDYDALCRSRPAPYAGR